MGLLARVPLLANGKTLDPTGSGLCPQQGTGLVSAQVLANADTLPEDDLLGSGNSYAFTVPK